MKQIYFYPYSKHSEGLWLIRDSLEELGNDALLIRKQNSKFKYGPNKLVINWGNWHCPYPSVNRDTEQSVNKLTCLEILKEAGVSVPPFTQSKGHVREWLERDAIVFARTLLTSHEGRGIVVLRKNDEIVDAPLYTRYIRKKKEYRVHVFDDIAIAVQEKRKRVGQENALVRNSLNGYVFCYENVDAPQELIDEAVKATKALGLDFGAVDVIWGDHKQKPYVLEVNTAPGVCPKTAKLYAQFFLEISKV